MKIFTRTRGLDALHTELSARLAKDKRRVAEQVVEKAQDAAPVKSGRLRDSIHVDEEGNVVADAPHAAAIELGTSRRAATPYLAPTAISSMGDWQEAVRQAVVEVARGF